jgi:F-box/TPR repeat protein Pof3
MIISYLTFKNMVNCLRVCKSWKTFLIHQPNLWKDLDFTGARKNVSRKFLRNAVNRSEQRVQRMTVHRCPDADILRNIATTCMNLTRIEFLPGSMLNESLIDIGRRAVRLKTFVYRAEITLETVTQFLRHRPTLQHAEFTSISNSRMIAQWNGPFSNLETLTLIGPKVLHQGLNASSLLHAAPSLKSLKLWNWGGTLVQDAEFAALPLESLMLSNVHLDAFPILPSSLKHLDLKLRRLELPAGDHNQSPEEARSWINLLTCQVSKLTSLGLVSVDNINSRALAALLQLKLNDKGQVEHISDDQAKIEKFSISNSTVSEEYPILNNPGGFWALDRLLTNKLRSLDFSKSRTNDDAIENLLSLELVGLEHLNLSQTDITGASVKMLVDKLPNLTTLDLNLCPHISSRDAIIYAQKRGIEISSKQAEAIVGGKKVRYG